MKEDRVKKLADKLYNQLVEEGWKNVSMERQLKRATEYYRIDALVKNCDLADVVGQSEQLKCEHEPKNPTRKHTSCKKCDMSLQIR